VSSIGAIAGLRREGGAGSDWARNQSDENVSRTIVARLRDPTEAFSIRFARCKELSSRYPHNVPWLPPTRVCEKKIVVKILTDGPGTECLGHPRMPR
jgi:hypothetical protein